MGRRRKTGQPIHGWIILDKADSMTSTHAVNQIRKLYNARKAGHAGTLDPLASGILPIALGEGTKTIPYIMDGVKHYEFTVNWGAETETDDRETEPVKTSDKRPSEQDVLNCMPKFTGIISQTPPAFSAIKINGERAYDLARDGQQVELQSREVEVHHLGILSHSADKTDFVAHCSKGTYIRSLARDMGRELGCLGHIGRLRRTKVGPFEIDNAISLDFLQNIVHSNDEEGIEDTSISDFLMPIETALDDILALAVDQHQAGRIRNGQSVLLRGANAPLSIDHAYTVHSGQVLAIGHVEKGSFIPTRVFAYGS